MKKIAVSMLLVLVFSANPILVSAKEMPVSKTKKAPKEISGHYEKIWKLCVDKTIEENERNAGSSMTSSAYTSCYATQNEIAEKELKELLILTTPFTYKTDAEYKREIKKIENKFERWKKKRDSECENNPENQGGVGAGISSCIAYSTIGYIQAIYRTNYKE